MYSNYSRSFAAGALMSLSLAASADVSPSAVENLTTEAGPGAEFAEVKEEEKRPTPSKGNRIIEEIIVTAQKREENLMEVPLSVQAFSQETLDARGITDQAGLQLVTPSLSIAETLSYATFFLRGIGSDAFITADPSIVNYLDGVYLPFPSGIIQDVGAVERVEVLKGPQGTLFGRNAVGGAIVTTSKNPDLTKQSTSVLLSYGKYNDRQARVYTSIPLIADSLALGVSVVGKARENYYQHSQSGGEPLIDDRSRAALVKALWVPTDNLRLTLATLMLKLDGSSAAFAVNESPNDVGKLLLIRPQTGFKGDNSFPALHTSHNEVTYGTVVYNGPWFDGKILASRQNLELFSSLDFDGSAVPIAGITTPDFGARVKTGELQLLSNDQSWGAEWLKWTGGVYLFKSVQGLDANLDVVDGIHLSTIAMQKTISTAVYGQASIAFTDWLSLTVGVRRQEEKREVVDSAVGARLPNQSSLTLIDWPAARDSDGKPFPLHAKTVSTKPKVSLEAHPFREDLLVYLSYQEAIKSGVYNAIGLTAPPQYVDPEETTAYEAGFKTTLFDGATRLEGAAFLYDMSDLQTQFLSLTGSGALSFENAGAARIQGVEISVASELLPEHVDGLAVALGATYLDAKYRNYDNAHAFAEVAGVCCVATDNADFTGNRIQRAPEAVIVATISKAWEIGMGTLDAAVDAYYSSQFYFSQQNSASSKQPAYQVYGARVSYLYEPWGTRLTLFGKNLLDERYAASNQQIDFGNLYVLGPPRTFGLRLNWDF